MTDAVMLVVMQRGGQYPIPHVVDVHPNEVENYRVGGFEVQPDAPPPQDTQADKPKTKRKVKDVDR